LVSVKHSEAAEPQANAAAARPLVGPTAAGVRTTSPVLAALIRQATGRSATFRGLIHTIEASDGIVHVSEGKCRHGLRACLPLTVTVAGPFRILFIFVRIDSGRADWAYMESIGHELRHAIEVLSAPKVTNDDAMFWFFKNEGLTRGANFETKAAIDAGWAVRDEMREAHRSESR
jgi:hypothetical protein